MLEDRKLEACKQAYKSIADLPGAARDHTPMRAQEIYKEAYTSAGKECAEQGDRRGDESREQAAHKVVWAAVKKKYSKGTDGDWHAS